MVIMTSVSPCAHRGTNVIWFCSVTLTLIECTTTFSTPHLSSLVQETKNTAHGGTIYLPIPSHWLYLDWPANSHGSTRKSLSQEVIRFNDFSAVSEGPTCPALLSAAYLDLCNPGSFQCFKILGMSRQKNTQNWPKKHTLSCICKSYKSPNSHQLLQWLQHCTTTLQPQAITSTPWARVQNFQQFGSTSPTFLPCNLKGPSLDSYEIRISSHSWISLSQMNTNERSLKAFGSRSTVCPRSSNHCLVARALEHLQTPRAAQKFTLTLCAFQAPLDPWPYIYIYIYIYIQYYIYIIIIIIIIIISYIYISSTAQGGGGSFKNRKPIGKVGCCESRMAERSHWWIERWLMSPLFLSLSLTIYLPTYLSTYVSIDLSIYLSLSFI